MKTLFVTGTNTEVGKTFYSCKLLQSLNQQGFTTAALKPIASGATMLNGKLANDDSLLLQQHASLKLPLEIITPYCFQEAIAPHIAAKKTGTLLQADKIAEHCLHYPEQDVDYKIIEGAGGLMVPLNHHETMLDVIKKLQAEVILVVKITLGCINHALLSYQQLLQNNLKLHSWVANVLEPDMPEIAENIATITEYLGVQGEVLH